MPLQRKIFLVILSKRNPSYLLFLIVAYSIFVSELRAQNPSAAEVFGKFRVELNEFKAHEKSPPLTASTQRVELDFQYLQNKMSAGARATPEYLLSLKSNAELLDAAQKNPRKAPELIAAAEQDLQIKVQHARRTTILGNVQVKIVTKKNGKEVSDYYIRCNPRVDGDREPCKFPLNNPSSPAIGELPPGVLLMWTVKGGAKSIAQPKIVDGTSSPQVIILEVP